MKATFENSVNVLVKAYLNDTLQLANCYACAVGNLVANANGYTMKHRSDCWDTIIWEESIPAAWFDACFIGHCQDNGLVKQQIDSIGYTAEQVKIIERAFELAYRRRTYLDKKDELIFTGLMNVVNALAEIHNIDLTVRESAKAMFVKA